LGRTASGRRSPPNGGEPDEAIPEHFAEKRLSVFCGRRLQFHDLDHFYRILTILSKGEVITLRGKRLKT